MQSLNKLKVPWELVGAIAVIAFVVLRFPELIWAFALIQILIIAGGVFYYKFIWRCRHCKLRNPTLKNLVTSQKVCDTCLNMDIPKYD